MFISPEALGNDPVDTFTAMKDEERFEALAAASYALNEYTRFPRPP